MKFKFLSILLFLCISSGLWASEEAVLRSSEDRVACMQYIAQVLPDCITCHREESFLASVTADLHSLSGRFEQIVACADKEGFHQDAFAKFQESIEEFCDTCALVHSRIEAEQNVLPRHIRLLIRKAANIEKKLEAAGKEDSSGHALLKVGADYYHLKTMIGNWARSFGITLQTFASFTGNKLNRLTDNLFFRPKDWFWGHRAYTIPVAVVLTALAAGGGYAYYRHREAKRLEEEALEDLSVLFSYQMPNLIHYTNSCYANAALKFLSVHPAIDELVSCRFETSDLAKGCRSFRTELGQLMKTINEQTRGQASALKVFEEFDKTSDIKIGRGGRTAGPAWKICDGKQHDSGDFLLSVLERCDADQNKDHCFEIRTTITRENKDGSTDSAGVIDDEGDTLAFKEERYKVVSSLELSMYCVKDISQALNNYFEEEVRTASYGPQKKKCELLNCPNSMIFTLQKIIGETINLEEGFCFNDVDYSLKAVIIHHGSTGGGHYYTWIRDVYDGKSYWTKHNDTQQEVDIEHDKAKVFKDIGSSGTVFLYVNDSIA